jgi:hypothetical protein
MGIIQKQKIGSIFANGLLYYIHPIWKPMYIHSFILST